MAPRLSLGFLLLAGLLSGAEPREKTAEDFRTEAAAAYQRKEYAVALDAMWSALELRPDSPRYLHHFAALSALTGDRKAAIDALRRIAALGLAVRIERDPDLASLQGTPEFLQLMNAFAANREPRGAAEVIAELPGRTGIIEGIAFQPRTGDFFLGDVHHRCIWRRDRDGKITRFTEEDDDLLGVFGVAIDEAHNALWAAMAAVPEMSGYTAEMKGHAALAEFNLATGELRRVIPAPGDGRDHGLGDLVVAEDGTVYVSDSKAPVVWQLVPELDELSAVVDSPVFGSLQGLVLDKRTLLVADYATGLYAIDLDRRSITPLETPKDTTLVGLDGLVAIPGGLIASQNGVDPQRLVRLALTAGNNAVTDVTVLAAGHPQFTDLTLMTLVHQRPTVLAGAGWDSKIEPGSQPPPHTVRIFQVALP